MRLLFHRVPAFQLPTRDLLVAVSSVFIFTVTQAQTVVDNFLTGGSNYITNSIVSQNPTVTGFTGAWAGPSSANISSTNLTFSNASGVVDSAGGSVLFPATDPGTPNAGRVTRGLTSAIDTGSDSTVYMSFIMENSLAGDTTQYRAFELNTLGGSDGARIFQLGLGNGDFGTTGYGFRVNSSNSLRGDLGVSNTTSNLFIVKFDLSSTASSDSVTVWVNPSDLSSESFSGLGVTVSGLTISGNIGQIQLASFNVGGSMGFDEFRVGNSWQSVSTVPEPSYSALLIGSLAVVMVVRRRRRS